MARYVALLRAINVGGHTVRMERLRALFEEIGFTGVETFIASGNVIFDDPGEPAELERRIEAHLHAALGYEVATFLRTPGELAAALAACPFDAAAETVFVGFSRDVIDAESIERLSALGDGKNDLAAVGREIYWWRRESMRETKITGHALERATGRRPLTMRNVTTVRALVEKYGAG
jgi:uncharacterized protein (DUF1697 family)